MNKFRDYLIERDEQRLPVKLIWRGDYEIPSKQALELEKLKAWEQTYGKREV